MNSLHEAPERFDEAFLAWFRARTETAWANWRGTTLEEYRARGANGLGWQQGTRWLGDLTDDEITSAERRWHVRFPPDYRLFLRTLYAVDRPMRGALPKGHELHPVERPAFPRWLSDEPLDVEYINDRFEWLYQGLEFDLAHNALWPASWGAKPPTLDAQKARLRELLAAAPKLIPVFGHRYLLGEPCQASNPVLSVYQSDIVVYGSDLRSYLLVEFSDLLGIDRSAAWAAGNPDPQASARIRAIPFWGELIEGEEPA
ncbi:MAG TPA: SMI1/KNR4 family protein [Ktedonobacterales bacterium]|nr:SMI1/KNR4 family protein [Ktedonobacterales bacterium]